MNTFTAPVASRTMTLVSHGASPLPRAAGGQVEALRAAEFFAGIGLVRAALERADWQVVFANDIEPFKHAMYQANFDASDFVLGDVRGVRGRQIPDIDLATASFPCTDLSLAGMRRGLDGEQSGMLWEFTRVIGEMGRRKPAFLLLENVPAFATSKGGADLAAAIERLNDLGYDCAITMGDARHFVPQSRQRLFIIGSRVGLGDLGEPVQGRLPGLETETTQGRLVGLSRFVASHPDLRVRVFDLALPCTDQPTLTRIVERLRPGDSRWWDSERTARFVDSLSPRQAARLDVMRASRSLQWATAYRRTRHGHSTWEIRDDRISGCLRTARGGSSRQALVEAGRGVVRVRWMTSREYAGLQGAPEFVIPETVTENQALSGFGDAVALPVVEWLVTRYLTPLARAPRKPAKQLLRV